jgi:hypothetical protein
MNDKISSLEMFLVYLRRSEAAILVREPIEGQWQSVALIDLPPDLWAKHVLRFLLQFLGSGKVPLCTVIDETKAADERFEPGA